MNRLLSWLIVAGLAVGISACDKKEGVPLPKTGAGEVKQQAKEAVGAVENAAKKELSNAVFGTSHTISLDEAGMT